MRKYKKNNKIRAAKIGKIILPKIKNINILDEMRKERDKQREKDNIMMKIHITKCAKDKKMNK